MPGAGLSAPTVRLPTSAKQTATPSRADIVKALQMGGAHLAAGRLDYAAAAARHVLQFMPKNADALHLLALVAHGKGDPAAAEKLIGEALKHAPAHPNLLVNLANSQRDQGKGEEALANYGAAISARPDFLDAFINRGVLLKEFGLVSKALRDFKQAMALAPQSPAPYVHAAETAMIAGHYRDAIAYCHTALQYVANPPSTLFALLAEFHERLTELDKALEFAEQARALDPQNIVATRIWAKIRRRMAGKDADTLREMRAVLEAIDTSGLDPEAEGGVEGDLAAICNDLGDIDAAFAHFVKQNAASAKSALRKRVDKQAYLDQVEEQIAAFTPEWVGSWSSRGAGAVEPGHRAAPVFLVGFPRSGTTLLDQILDAHPDVQVFEEQPTLIAVRDALASYPSALAHIDERERQRLRALYWDALETGEADLKSKVVINKLPLNIIHAGLMQAVFPEARIILALRHPADSVLSCFMQNFELNASMANFLTLHDAAHLYDRVMTLWRQYRRLLPLNVVEVRYENLIRDIRAEVEPVLDFLGLPWNDAQADPAAHALARGTIRTPSYAQVTQPIYSSSADRWRRYEKHLAPVLPMLETHIRHFGYDL